MPSNYKINAKDFEEYLAVLARCSEVPMDEEAKLRELLRSYSELKFKIVGGKRCAVCNAHVRHVISVASEQANGEIKRFECLCTRCLEGEKSTSRSMFLEVGDKQIEVKLEKRESPDKVKPAALVAKAHKRP